MRHSDFRRLVPVLLLAGAVPLLSARISDSRTSSAASSARVVASAGHDSPRNLKQRVKGKFSPAPRSTATGTPHREAPSATPAFTVTVSSYGDMADGLYSFTPGSDEFTEISTDPGFNAEYGAVLAGDIFFNVGGDGKARRWNPYDWTLISEGESEAINATAMACSDGGVVYACVYPRQIGGVKVEDGMMLVTIDTEAFVRSSTIATLDEGISAMFFKNGTLYGIGADTSTLYSVDTESGALTEIGYTGIGLDFGGSAGVDPATGTVFVACNGWDIVGLYELSVADGQATLIQEFTDDIALTSMSVIGEKPNDDVPGTASAVEFDFAGASLSGTINVTAPEMSFAGNPLSGELTYSVVIAGGDPATGSVAPGAVVALPYTAGDEGLCEVSATFANQAGDGPAYNASAWIGADTPRSVANVSFTRENGVNTVTWDAVTGGVHNGFVDLDDLTYTVTRNSDGQEFAGLTQTSLTDIVADPAIPESVTYSVKAVAGGKESSPAESNYVMAGATYYNGFDTQQEFDTMDSRSLYGPLLGEDAPTWKWYSWRQAASVDSEENRPKEAWLTSPAIRLEAGKAYNLSFAVWASHESYTERITVYISDTNNPQTIYQQGTPLIEAMTVNWESDAAQTPTATFTPDASGDHYIVFRACSDADMGTLFVDDILLAPVPVVAIPAAPTVTAVHDGNLGAEVTVTAPTLDSEGGQLASLLDITLQRDGTTVKVFDNPAPGQVLTFTETLPAEATYVYTAVARDANGRSEAASYSLVTATPGVPAAPSAPALAETADDGEVTLSWIAPRLDVKGQPVNEAELTYSIYPAGSDEAVATGISGTTHTFRAVEPGSQAFVSYTVSATGTVGEGARSSATKPVPVGTPSAMPYAESFAAMQFTNPWIAETIDDSDAQWLLVEASATPQAQPQDGDGGMLAFEAEFLNDRAALSSGKIAVGEDAVLSFWYFAQNSKAGKDELAVQIVDGDQIRTVDNFSMRDEQKEGWTNRQVSLAQFAGKNLRIRLVGTSFRTENLMLVDNFSVTAAGVDMEATGIYAPAQTAPGMEFTVSALVTNLGSKEATDVKISLLRDGSVVATEECGTIAASKSHVSTFAQTADLSWNESVVYSFVVEAPDDIDPANNTGAEATVTITGSDLPGTSGLKAFYNGEDRSDVTVEWTAPDFDNIAGEEYTESFERYESFAVNPDRDWTFVDGDGADTYGITGLTFPGANGPMAFVAFDSYGLEGAANIAAHSGSRYMASFGAQPDGNGNPVTTDDWMISPELGGEAQTISFWANSYSDRYGLESLEVLASSTGTETSSFTSVLAVDAVPKGWTRYEVQLPEGTKHFAIRNVSTDRFALFIDDVTFTPARHHASWFDIVGFNVYRDGVKMNDEPLQGTSYVDTDLPEGTPRYAVSVVYDCGESRLGEYVSPTLNSIDGVTADGVTVSAGRGVIRVTAPAATRVTVSDSLGATVFAGEINGAAEIAVSGGVYMVTTPAATRKILVK